MKRITLPVITAVALSTMIFLMNPTPILAAPGDIGAVLDSEEFDTNEAREPSIVRVADDVVAIAYRDSNDDGWLKTYEINASGIITSPALDTLEFDTNTCYEPHIIHVSSNIYAIAYRGSSDDGFLRTISITATGDIGTVIESLEFDTSNCWDPSITHVTGDIYAIAYRGPSDRGYLKTVSIDAAGDIGTVIDTEQFDTNKGEQPSIVRVSSSVVAIAYRDSSGYGQLRTYEINVSGIITNGYIDTLEFDSTQCYEPCIIHVSGNIYAIAYRGPSDRGYLKTVSITAAGDIGNTVLDTEQFDNLKCQKPCMVLLDYCENAVAIAYEGPDDDGWLKNYEINPTTGAITNGPLDTLEFDNQDGQDPSITHVTGDIYAISYRGKDDDGWLKTISIEGCCTPPVANFTASPTSGCAPLTINFNDTSTGSPTDWSWDFDNDGNPDSTDQNPSYQYTIAGTYTVKLTVTNACGSDDETKTGYVTVYANPDCTITAPSAVCEGTTGHVASVPDAGGGASYSWTLSGDYENLSGQGTNSITWDATAYNTGNVNIEVTVTNGNGCSCTDDVDVTVYANPDCTITAPSAVCEESTGNSASVSDAGNGATYTWNLTSGTITDGNGTNSITWSADPGATTVEIDVTVQTVAGCSCTATTKNVTVKRGSISGYVWNDTNEDGIRDPGETGIANITVALLNATDKSLISYTETDVNGYYLFSDLAAGDYIVDVDQRDTDLPEGYCSTTYNDPADVSILACEDKNVDFGYALFDEADYGNIGNLVWDDINANGQYDDGEPGIAFVTLFLKNESGDTILETTETDFFGNYMFYNYPSGYYIVEVDLTDPDLAGYTATTATSVVAVIASCFMDADFGFTSTPPPPPPSTTTTTGGHRSCSFEINMLGEIVKVSVECCNNSTISYHMIYDPEHDNFFSIDRGTPVICGDCVGCGSYPLLVEITVAEGFPDAPEGTKIIAAYDCTAYKGKKVCSHVTFGKPVALLLTYDPDELPENTSSVFMARYNLDLGEWEPLPPDTGRIAEVGEATGLISQFSTFAVVAQIGQLEPQEPEASLPPADPTPQPPPAHFVASDLNINTSRDVTGMGNFIFTIKEGESVEISANLANGGGKSGEYDAVLKINGEIKTTRKITLGPGQGQEIIFNVANLEPGKYIAQLDNLTAEFTVTRWMNWPLIVGMATACGLLVWAILYLIRRRKRGYS
ncbi:MAG: SdrD B-like domain-containing protein [Dehalococcoidales bacterium]|nr:SdrD B-like domain-containing protein [Dehalococcoidales bacterium]